MQTAKDKASEMTLEQAQSWLAYRCSVLRQMRKTKVPDVIIDRQVELVNFALDVYQISLGGTDASSGN